MQFPDLIIKNVLRRKVRSSLTGIGVAVAIAAVVGLLGISGGFERSFAESFSSRGVDLMVVRAGIAQHRTSNLNIQIGDRIRRLPHVAKVVPTLDDMGSFGEANLIGIPVHGWPEDNPVFETLSIVRGKRLTSKTPNGVMLGSVLAGNLGKKPSEDVEIEQTKFHVVGIFESPNVFDNGSAIVLLPALQKLMDHPDKVSQFQVVLKKDMPDKQAELELVKKEIEGLRGADGKLLGLSATPTQEFISNNLEIRLARAMAWMTSFIALVIGAVGVLNTMIMSVLERTQEIGILRAIGWHKGRIVRMILWESFVLSLVGAVIGVAFALLLTRALSHFPAARGFIRPDISFSVIALGFLMSLLVGLAGGAYPAYRGANLLPTEALHYE